MPALSPALRRNSKLGQGLGDLAQGQPLRTKLLGDGNNLLLGLVVHFPAFGQALPKLWLRRPPVWLPLLPELDPSLEQPLSDCFLGGHREHRNLLDGELFHEVFLAEEVGVLVRGDDAIAKGISDLVRRKLSVVPTFGRSANSK
jgi:hypothetical protein